MIIDVLEDVYPSNPEFIKEESFPFGGKNFFQEDITGSQVRRDHDFPQLIDFRGQGF